MNSPVRSILRATALALSLACAFPAAAAPFVYRGSLVDSGAPAEGEYGFRLTFYDRASGGEPIASAITIDGVAVREGAFSASVDLAQALLARDTIWLQAEVRDAHGAFVPIAAREAVEPKALTAGVCWDVDGNAGTSALTNVLGTTDGAALRIQSAAGVGVNTVTPLASLHVRSGGTSLSNATPDPGTIINAEKASGNAFISVMGAAQRGLIFGEPGSTADGGIFYDNASSSALEFRTAANVTRMKLGVSDVDGAGNNPADTALQLFSTQGGPVYLSATDAPGFLSLDVGFTGFQRTMRMNLLNTTLRGDLFVTGTAFRPGGGPWADSSDLRLKKNVAPLDGALDQLLALRGVHFEYANPDDMHPAGVRTGFIAQEVQQVFPQWVKPGSDGYLTVGSHGFEALTVESLRTLKQAQETSTAALGEELASSDARHGAEVAELARENAQLRARLERLEAALARRASADR